jgi:hypothetical protein
MIIDKHVEEIPMFVTQLGHYPVVLGIPWLNQHDVSIRFKTKTVSFNSDYCLQHCSPIPATTKGITIPIPETKHRIAMIAGAAFSRLLSKNKELTGSITVYELLQALKQLTKQPQPEDDDERIRQIVPSDYHHFLPLFKKAVADKLPPHRKYDHTIPLKNDFEPPFGPFYSLSRNELLALKEWIQDNPSKGFIRALSSPAHQSCSSARNTAPFDSV